MQPFPCVLNLGGNFQHWWQWSGMTTVHSFECMNTWILRLFCELCTWEAKENACYTCFTCELQILASERCYRTAGRLFKRQHHIGKNIIIWKSNCRNVSLTKTLPYFTTLIISPQKTHAVKFDARFFLTFNQRQFPLPPQSRMINQWWFKHQKFNVL